MDTPDTAKIRLLRQIKRAGAYGTWVRRGRESVAHKTLVERGLLLQSVADDPEYWRFEIAPAGKAALANPPSGGNP